MKPEFKIISDLINENSQVLDVGCGDGILMEFLIKEKKVNIRGIEISKTKVQNCIAKGLTIIEGNAEDDLRQFLSDKLAAFKIPSIIEFMKTNLPLVASGKFDKNRYAISMWY